MLFTAIVSQMNTRRASHTEQHTRTYSLPGSFVNILWFVAYTVPRREHEMTSNCAGVVAVVVHRI